MKENECGVKKTQLMLRFRVETCCCDLTQKTHRVSDLLIVQVSADVKQNWTQSYVSTSLCQ